MNYKSVGVFKSITDMVDQWLQVYIIYLVFQKAFDKVLHRKLLDLLKLKALGNGGGVLNWIDDWFKCRRQRVMRVV